jgi:type IV pilus assembly protein PilB
MDGVLVDIEHHPKRLLSAIIGRIKIMTGTMQFDEKRIPQDGRIQMSL